MEMTGSFVIWRRTLDREIDLSANGREKGAHGEKRSGEDAYGYS